MKNIDRVLIFIGRMGLPGTAAIGALAGLAAAAVVEIFVRMLLMEQ